MKRSRLAALLARRPRLVPALACCALAVALLLPAFRLPKATFNYVVALDITQSMGTEDYRLQGRPVSRLGYAKHALRQALLDLPCGSRVGLALFTEYRLLLLFTPVEICANFGDVSEALNRVESRMAWAGASEVAKGLYSAIRIVEALEGCRLVFVTDGHEAPPLHPRYRPEFDGRPGEVRGLILGTGGDVPVPIPKRDPDGNELGYWSADEVLQTDTVSAGRRSSISGEVLVDERGMPERPSAPTGNEHLSSLRETHLRALAAETGLGYMRLTDANAATRALSSPDLALEIRTETDVSFVPAALALLLLAWHYSPRRPPTLSSRT